MELMSIHFASRILWATRVLKELVDVIVKHLRYFSMILEVWRDPKRPEAGKCCFSFYEGTDVRPW